MNEFWHGTGQRLLRNVEFGEETRDEGVDRGGEGVPSQGLGLSRQCLEPEPVEPADEVPRVEVIAAKGLSGPPRRIQHGGIECRGPIPCPLDLRDVGGPAPRATLAHRPSLRLAPVRLTGVHLIDGYGTASVTVTSQA